ncbi:uncharacterized protein LOC126735844 [Anthonomus grandis grandis]|uniref:uncharacterized protein LOC126735844 n=1 Tax=Anthonomus grandis grandis TaxID=2921223 RepID=UPI0021651000|nr:uncharacterized protein LOC126735844 [Anthonomus grandis grandis]
MDKNTKKGLRETRAQYVLRLATQNNELAPKASEPNMLTNINTDNDAFDIQNNIIILSPTNVDFSSNNHSNNIIIEEVSQMDPGPDGHEYVKTILDDNDLQAELQSNGELLIINKYCEGQNCSLEQNVIIEGTNNTQEQEVTPDIDADHFISNDSDQGSNYDPENKTSGSISEYSSENGEEVRGESEEIIKILRINELGKFQDTQKYGKDPSPKKKETRG